MTDNLGLNQTRVLDSSERSFESVTYQRKKPPLSCEVNLTGKLAAEHAQGVFNSLSASGWNAVGSIRDSETNVKTGDLVCSSTYAANSIKLMAPTDLIAWVNGMRVVVNESLINLGAPPSGGVNFVFLEVWRKLVTPSDAVYENGDFLGATLTNDLEDPSIGIETSLRIQIQYRIRVAECAIENYPDGFDPYRVFLQGPLSSPLSGSNYFTQVPGDFGLWRAGTGDAAAQTLIGTVDGYTYAIPICAIARRNTYNYDPIIAANGAGRTLANYLAGLPSDRPDNKYSDYIVADDILDLRHKITGSSSAKELCEKAFRKLVRGELRSKISKNTVGEDHYGVTLIQPDGISPNPTPGWFNNIGVGDGQRRVFSNAGTLGSIASQTLTLSDMTTVTPWINGSNFTLSSSGNITSIDNVYVTGASSATSLMPYGTSTPISGYGTILCVGPNGVSASYNGDPTNWTELSTGTLYGKVILAGDRYLAIDSNDIVTSMDEGQTWSIFHASNLPTDIAWNTDTIVVIRTDYTIESTSDNGATWDSTVTATSLNKVIWGGGQFLAVGNLGDTATSADGITWADHLGAAGADITLKDAIWNGTNYVAIGYDTNLSQGAILLSNNGIAWNPATVPVYPDYFNSIAMNSTTMIAVGYGKIVASFDNGSTWAEQVSPSVEFFTDVSWTGVEFIAVTDIGEIITSYDGVNWNTQTTLTTGGESISNCNIYVSGSTVDVVTNSLQDYPITVKHTVDYDAGPNGFTQLPVQVLEFRSELADSSSIASIDADIPVRTSDATANAWLSNRGDSGVDANYDFGHQMIYHVKGNGTTQLTFNRDLFGYNILGVASLFDGVSYRSLTNVVRSATQYTISSSPVFTLNADMTLNLYTEGKFFTTSNQGRGIIDCMEMKEYTPFELADNARTTFHVDTTNKAVLRIASNNLLSGLGIAYVDGVQTTLSNNNVYLPTDNTASRATVEISVAPTVGQLIEVPVLTKSAIEASEGYVCYYKTLPYQGMLTAEAQGVIEAEGPVIITTAGSGSIPYGDSNQENVIDRMPALSESNDCQGWNESIAIGNFIAITSSNPTLETLPRVRVQDILDQEPDNVHIGVGNADRGRKTIHIDGAGIDLGNLGLRYESVVAAGLNYKKTYQSYAFNKDSSGELYMMVVGSETDNASYESYLNEDSNDDVVDIFRLPGRPIRKVE